MRDAGGARYLDAAPLVALVEAAGVAPPRRFSRAWSRAKASGRVTRRAGDVLAVNLLAMHPAEVWGDEWWELAP